MNNLGDKSYFLLPESLVCNSSGPDVKVTTELLTTSLIKHEIKEESDQVDGDIKSLNLFDNDIKLIKPKEELLFLKDDSKENQCCESIGFTGIKLNDATKLVGSIIDDKYQIKKFENPFKKDVKVILEKCDGLLFELNSSKYNSKNNLNQVETYNPTVTLKKIYKRELMFRCKYCKKTFPQIGKWKEHERIHTGEKPYSCSVCSKLFRTITLLKLHTRIHTGKPHPCEKCNKRFSQVGSLKLHMLAHKGERPFKCVYCSLGFYTKSGVSRHVKNVHIEKNESGNMKLFHNNVFTCSYCIKVFKSKISLSNHIATNHTHKESWECEICGKHMISYKNLQRHKKVHENSFPYTCADCKISFKWRSSLLSHIKQHFSNGLSKQYSCNDCHKSFKTKSNLVIHFEIHHNNNKIKYVCELCGLDFSRLTYLKRHSKIHSGTDRIMFCDTCDFTCRSKSDIRNHVLTHIGGGDKPFKCELCNSAFPKRSKLKRHQLVHSDSSPYKCEYCNKCYKDKDSLKCHHNMHMGKTFICDNCGFKSINEHSFKRHMRKTCKNKK